MALAAQHDRGAFGDGVRHMLFHFCHGLLVDERALVSGAGQAIAHAQTAHCRRELFREGIVDAGLYKQAVGANAGLPRVAVLAGHGALHGGVEIAVIEDDEGCIAAEFERQLLQLRRALGHQLDAHGGGAGKGDLAHGGVRGHLAPNLGGRAGDDTEQALRQTSAFRQHGHGQC